MDFKIYVIGIICLLVGLMARCTKFKGSNQRYDVVLKSSIIEMLDTGIVSTMDNDEFADI